MTRQLHCATSGCVVDLVWGQIPAECPVCARPTVWRTMPWKTDDEPKKPYELSAGDRRLLRSLRIAPDS